MGQKALMGSEKGEAGQEGYILQYTGGDLGSSGWSVEAGG